MTLNNNAKLSNFNSLSETSGNVIETSYTFGSDTSGNIYVRNGYVGHTAHNSVK